MAASESRMHAEHKQSGKKLAKKLLKVEKYLSDKENLVITKEITQILCVQNGGLGNGVSQEELTPLFSQFGNLEGFVMLPQKQYCFVCYTHAASAAQAHTELNGCLLKTGKDPTQDVILYLCFVEKAPASVAPSSERPPGLIIVEEFVSEEMEKALIDYMDMDTDCAYEENSVMKHRKVKHFGFEFKYSINDVDVKDPLPSGIPDVCHGFITKAQERGLVKHFPDQLTINSYQPGQGIPPHVDTREAFEDGIMSLSLGSAIVMDFRHPDGRHISVFLPRRSMVVMNGESRYVWSHGITPRKSDIVPGQTSSTTNGCNDTSSPSTDSNCSNQMGASSDKPSTTRGLTLQARHRRVSYTFRKVVMDRPQRMGQTVGVDEHSGESTVEDTSVPKTDEEAVALERKHVNKVYEDIAEHFSGTRYKPWPRVVDFVMEQPALSLLADVGCGNGKCLGHNKNLFEIGSDFSGNLASICHSRGFETCVGDVTCLPFRTESFDVVLCIAVIHHMATKNRRLKALSEVVRILRKGGKALVYVWAMEQELNKAQSKYIKPSRQQKQFCQGERDYSDCGLSSVNSEEEQSNSDYTTDTTTGTGASAGTETGNLEMDCQSQHLESNAAHDSDANAEKNVKSAKAYSHKDNGDPSCAAPDGNKVSGSQCSPVKQISIRHVKKDSLVDNEPGLREHVTSDLCGITEGSTSSSQSEPQQKRLSVHVNRTQFKDQDLLVPWQLKGKHTSKHADNNSKEGSEKADLFHRFYHVFRQGELEAMCKKVPSCAVLKSYYDQGNWCVVLEKL